MTIKQQGGIFGRNPTFNDVTVDNDISVTGSITADNAIIAGSETSLQSNITISPQDNYNRTLTIKTDEMEFSAPSSFGANYNAKIQFIPSVLKFYTGNGTSVNEAAKFDGSGNLVFPSGQGIDFSATSGTGTSELFDDYEEGTWTPTFTSTSASFSYTNQFGSYVKIGGFVSAQFYLNATASGTTSNQVTLSGLPFASANLNAFAQSAGSVWFTGTANVTPLVSNNAATAVIWKNNTAASNLNAVDVSGHYFVGTVFYRAS